jgi:[protein-PII] uridylyltransferase
VPGRSGQRTLRSRPLIEARLLTGNATLFKSFETRLRSALDPQAFFEAKRLEQDERYMRFQDTPYSLEPNCKESPGGLRDLQSSCGSRRLPALAQLARSEARTASSRRRSLSTARANQLPAAPAHPAALLVGRREDRLLFDYQTQLAEQLGFRSDQRGAPAKC